jgi:hypothetical protein
MEELMKLEATINGLFLPETRRQIAAISQTWNNLEISKLAPIVSEMSNFFKANEVNLQKIVAAAEMLNEAFRKIPLTRITQQVTDLQKQFRCFVNVHPEFSVPMIEANELESMLVAEPIEIADNSPTTAILAETVDTLRETMDTIVLLSNDPKIAPNMDFNELDVDLRQYIASLFILLNVAIKDRVEQIIAEILRQMAESAKTLAMTANDFGNMWSGIINCLSIVSFILTIVGVILSIYAIKK